MTPLIPLSYLNEACFLSLNEDDKKYTMCLKMSQDDLEDILAGEFFEEIETQYRTTTLTTDNATLYDDYIKDYLAWKTYFNYLKFANTNPTPTGIREFNDENSSVASDIKMYSLEKNVLAEANKYKFRMINFMKLERSKDSTKYPLWIDSCKEQLSFAITSVDKNSDAMFKVNKAIVTNE